MMQQQDEDAVFGPVIHSYSRAQALVDGYLIDASTLALEAGIGYPVAVTRGLWDRHIAVPQRLTGLQDETGRLWDMLWMFRQAAGRGGRKIAFTVLFAEKRGRPPVQRQVTAVCGPDDDGEPVITLMLPDED